jgi:hypothetical protein
MPHLEYFVVAESFAIDGSTNRVSVFNVLEDISTSAFPTTFPSLVAIASWNAEPGDDARDFQAAFLVRPPGSAEPRRFDVNFRIPDRRARTLVQVVGLPLVAPGNIEFEVQLNGVHQAGHTAVVLEAQIVPTFRPLQ